MGGRARIESFQYFAYGSNLLRKRLLINNPSATFFGIGKLENHLLDFVTYAERWGGCCATLVPVAGPCVWGAVWTLSINDMPALDVQEGVEINWYFAKTVNILCPNGGRVMCRTYQQRINPPLRREEDVIPPERRPSVTYMEVIIKGAIECKLPKDYIEKLKRIPNNGRLASPDLLSKL